MNIFESLASQDTSNLATEVDIRTRVQTATEELPAVAENKMQARGDDRGYFIITFSFLM